MTNLIKTISITLLITLSMAFISCKNDETDPNAGGFKKSDLIGTWNGSGSSFTINSSGYVNFTYQDTTYNGILLDSYQLQDETIIFGLGTGSYESGYNENAQFQNGDKRKLASFNFSSSSSCTVSIREDTYSGTSPSGSWQLGSANSIGTFTK